MSGFGRRCPGSREKLDFLREPGNYPDGPARVEVVETHFAWVFLTERHAYKMKKPVRRDTMDYRALASRERGCRNELELNRRLAPWVYLAVVPLGLHENGRLALGRGREVVDWLVQMLRLPAGATLECAIVEGRVGEEEIGAIVRLLASFYATAARRPLPPQAYCRRLRRRTAANAGHLAEPALGLSPALFEPVIAAQQEYLMRMRRLVGARGERLVDCHGDLRPEHVFLEPRPCAIDCLEYDSDLRRLDPAEEAAFLALECARLGRRDLGALLLARLRSGMHDPAPDHLLHYYQSQSAVTRAKLAAWHLHDPAYADRPRWIGLAHSYLEDAAERIAAALAGCRDTAG